MEPYNSSDDKKVLTCRNKFKFDFILELLLNNKFKHSHETDKAVDFDNFQSTFHFECNNSKEINTKFKNIIKNVPIICLLLKTIIDILK